MQKFFYFFFAFILILALGITLWIFFGKKETPTQLGAPGASNPFGEAADAFMSSFIGLGRNTETSATGTYSERFTSSDMPITKVWDKPVAGAQFVQYEYLLDATSTSASGTPIVRQERATSTLLMFIERATGYVYGYDLRSKTVSQMTNTLIPGLHDAYIFSNGSSGVVRFLDRDINVIRSLYISIPRVALGRDPIGLDEQLPLPNNITSITHNPSGTSLSYLVPNETTSSLYTLSTTGATTRKEVSLSEWKIIQTNTSTLLVSKPSAYIQGSVLDTSNNTRTLSNRTGLMISAAPSNGAYLASMWSRSGISTFIFDTKTGTTSLLPFSTLAEKCIWNNLSNYVFCGVPKSRESNTEGFPDDWYQGRVSFNDTFVVTRKEDAVIEFGLDIENEMNEPVDIISPNVSPDGFYVQFLNKKDGSLWMIDLLLAEELQD